MCMGSLKFKNFILRNPPTYIIWARKRRSWLHFHPLIKTQTTFSLLLSEGPKEVSRVFKGYTKVRCLDGAWSFLVDVCSVSGWCQKGVGSMWRCLNDVLLLFKDLFIQDIMGKNFILETKSFKTFCQTLFQMVVTVKSNLNWDFHYNRC